MLTQNKKKGEEHVENGSSSYGNINIHKSSAQYCIGFYYKKRMIRQTLSKRFFFNYLFSRIDICKIEANSSLVLHDNNVRC